MRLTGKQELRRVQSAFIGDCVLQSLPKVLGTPIN